MILEQLEKRPLGAPPAGTFIIAVARHELPGSNDPRIAELHAARSTALHGFVDELGLSDVVWGETDAPRPREIVEIVVPIASTLVSAAAALLSAWISRPRNKREGAEPGPAFETPTAGIKLRRADGAELYIDHRMGLNATQQRKMIASFLAG